MSRETTSRSRRWRAEHGTSAVEYALIVAGAGTALIGGVVVLSGGVKTAYEASAQGAEGGVTVDQEAAGTNDRAAVPEATPLPSPSDVPTSTATPTASATPTPAPTRPKGAIKVGPGDEADPVDIGVPGGAKGFTATVDPEWAGGAYLDKDDELVFEAFKSADSGTPVTVSWSYTKGGKLYEGTTTYWID